MEKKKPLHFLAELLFVERKRNLASKTMTRDVMFTFLEKQAWVKQSF